MFVVLFSAHLCHGRGRGFLGIGVCHANECPSPSGVVLVQKAKSRLAPVRRTEATLRAPVFMPFGGVKR